MTLLCVIRQSQGQVFFDPSPSRMIAEGRRNGQRTSKKKPALFSRMEVYLEDDFTSMIVGARLRLQAEHADRQLTGGSDTRMSLRLWLVPRASPEAYFSRQRGVG